MQTVDTAPPHMPTWEELQARVNRPLVRPMWVVRPNPPLPDEEEEDDDDDEDSGSDGESRPPAREPVPAPMNRSVMLRVFSHLSVKDLQNVMQVCKPWAQWAIHPSLWKTIRLTHKKINVRHLMGVVRRQPDCLDLSWSRLTKEQLSWVLARLPQLRELHLEGQSWQTISCLTAPYCPPLSVLNISYCEGIIDSTLNALLSSPRNHRPGHRDTTTRLKQLTDLRLAGTQVGDEGVCSIVRSLPFLTALNLSSCLHITEMTAALLAHPSSVVSHSLSFLDLRGCHRIAPTCLPSLKCLPLLAKLAIHPCSQIPLKALKVWGKHHGYTLVEEDVLTRAPPPPPDPTDDPMTDSEVSSLSRSPSPDVPSKSKQDQDDSKDAKEKTERTEKEKTGSEGKEKEKANPRKSPDISDEPPAKKPKTENSESKVSSSGAKDEPQSNDSNKEKSEKLGAKEKPGSSGAKEKSEDDDVERKSEKAVVKDKSEKTAVKEKPEKVSTNSKEKSEKSAVKGKCDESVKEKPGDTGEKGKSGTGGKYENTSSKEKSESTGAKGKSESTGAKEKTENTSKSGNKGVKSSSDSPDTTKAIETKRKEASASPSGSIRVSTRRQSRMQEWDSDSNSNLSEGDKTAPEKTNKKVQSESKSEKNSSHSEQTGKKMKTQTDQTSGLKGSTSQEKNKDKLESKDSSSPSLHGQKKDTSTVKKESNQSRASEKEKVDVNYPQGKKSGASLKEEERKVPPITLHGRNIKPLTISCTRSDKIPSELLKTESTSQSNKKEETHSSSSKKENESITKPIVESKKEGQGLNKNCASAEEKPSKKSSSTELTASKVLPNVKDASKENSSTESFKRLPVSEKEQKNSADNPSPSRQGFLKRGYDSCEQSDKKTTVSTEESTKKTAATDTDKKLGEKALPQTSKSSDSQMNQRNVIVTSVEVHRADNYDGTPDAESGGRRPERRLSVRRSKDEPDEKQEKNEKAITDSLKDKRRDSKSREEEMNKITVEDSQDKDSKSNKKRVEEKDKKAGSKKITLKQNYPMPIKIKQEKDIVTRSTKRLKTEKEMEEKQAEQSKEEISLKISEKSPDMRKNIRKSKDSLDDKEESVHEDVDKKDIKSPKPLSAKKDKENPLVKTSDKKEEDKLLRRNRIDTEEYMSKLRRKSHDSDGSNDQPTSDIAKKEETTEEKIRSRRRSVRDEDIKNGSEKKPKDEPKEEKKVETSESGIRGGKSAGDLESSSKQSKRKNEETDEGEPSKKIKEDTEEGVKTAKKPSETMRERSGSRERPERAHRSPRRLSMCQ